MVRLGGKREIGELGPLDLRAMLLLSLAFTADDTSLAAALTAVVTLILLNVIVGSRTLERLIEGERRTSIEEGRVNRAPCEREHRP
jgi:uncharacterized membrane protein YcaP (DUF421 family)